MKTKTSPAARDLLLADLAKHVSLVSAGVASTLRAEDLDGLASWSSRKAFVLLRVLDDLGIDAWELLSGRIAEELLRADGRKRLRFPAVPSDPAHLRAALVEAPAFRAAARASYPKRVTTGVDETLAMLEKNCDVAFALTARPGEAEPLVDRDVVARAFGLGYVDARPEEAARIELRARLFERWKAIVAGYMKDGQRYRVSRPEIVWENAWRAAWNIPPGDSFVTIRRRYQQTTKDLEATLATATERFSVLLNSIEALGNRPDPSSQGGSDAEGKHTKGRKTGRTPIGADRRSRPSRRSSRT